MSDIVHTEKLDDYNTLTIKDVPENAPLRYAWRIRFFNENGEYYGSCSDGSWSDTITAAISAGYIHYLLEEQYTDTP